MMQPSPYTPGEVARTVPGRRAQLVDFEERLSYLVDLHRLVGRIRVDHAPRGFGKTSLLRQYQRKAAERGVMTIWVTAGDSGGLVEQIAAEIGRATTGWRSAAQKSINKHLDSLTLRLGIPAIASIDATVRPAKENIATPPDSREFEALVRAAAAGDTHSGLVILIDEVQSADAEGLRTLAYTWQHLQSEGNDVPAAVFAAGLPNVPEVVSAAVTFSERFAYRKLRGLDSDAEEFALSVPAGELGVTWEREAITVALDTAHGYPYLVQLIADATWSAAGRPNPGGVITASHVHAARVMVDDDMEALFRARWANTSEGEKTFMTAMASLGSDTARRADIARVLGVTSESLSVPRARLIEKGIIQAESHGQIDFTIPGFAAFIRNLN